ncbi:hypothetical protein A4G19_13055 [Pasteurellaceae bacterium Macca]|nr:hypothetical protein [Pasteurellaceae bacterium Macca]MCK3656624.1 hypothetical protein [Pasteurellaceae bacterium Macca]
MMYWRNLSVWLALLILSLGSWSWYQSSVIDSLKADNHAQAQTITEQQQANSKLQQALRVEQQAVENQRKFATTLRKQTENKREQIKTVLVKEPCGVTALPDSVRDSIKRLHK